MSEQGGDVMLYIGGSKQSYRCECGCNVFRRTGEPEQYACNSCGLLYSSSDDEERTRPA